MRVGIFICECGGNISCVVDVKKVQSEAKSMLDVVIAEVVTFLCLDNGLAAVRKAIKRNELDRVVIASCSPHMYEKTFRKAVSEAGLNRYLMEYVNIREHCSWVHKDTEKATAKAIDLVSAGVYRARALVSLEPLVRKVSKEAVVIGGGVAGIMCALQVADSGYPVTLIERSPSIGGRMAQLSEMFPTLDCAPCILSPRMADVAHHPNIRLLTRTELEQVTGGVGDFHITVRLQPRGVDAHKCVGCGRCAEACEQSVPNEFDEGRYQRKAVYKPFPEAVPPAYVIDFENCVRCGACVEVCPTEAINLEEEPVTEEINAGTIIVATGFDLMDLSQRKNYGLQYPNVITALQMERIMINEMGAGSVLKRHDGKRVKKIAYILCTGSRDPHHGVPYCSKVCCAYAIKHAVILKKTIRYMDVWIYYTDIRMSGRGFEEFYREAREMGINFIQGKPSEVAFDSETERLQIIAEDKDLGVMFRNDVDMVVLTPAIIASSGTVELAEKLKIPLGADYFIAEKHPKLAPVMTHRPGIFIAGTALGPKDVRDSVSDAQAAAAHAVKLLGSDAIELEPVVAVVDAELCDGCGECVAICPQECITITDSKALVDSTICTGCGACVTVCPENAVEVQHYTTVQIDEQIKGTLAADTEDIRILGFLDDETAYSALDAAGTARLDYSESIRPIRVPSTAGIGLESLMRAFASGADGIMLFETDGSPEMKVVEKHLEEFHRKLEEYGVEKQRLMLQPILLPVFRFAPQFIKTCVSKIKKLGKLSPDIRHKIAETLS